MYQATNTATGSVVGKKIRRATSLLDRMVGLLGRKSLSPDEGLWLWPCNSIHTYFMRFPIDALFLSATGEIVRLYESFDPYQMTKIIFSAKSVLELPAGTIARTGCALGQTVAFTETD